MAGASTKIPQVQADDPKMNQFQVMLGKALQGIIACPINYGTLLTGIALAPGAANAIPHKLNRTLQGWILTRQRLEGGAATIIGIQDGQSDNRTPDRTLVLYATQAVTVDIWVF